MNKKHDVEPEELIDVIDELFDLETVKAVQEGNKAIKSGAKGISASEFINKAKNNIK